MLRQRAETLHLLARRLRHPGDRGRGPTRPTRLAFEAGCPILATIPGAYEARRPWLYPAHRPRGHPYVSS